MKNRNFVAVAVLAALSMAAPASANDWTSQGGKIKGAPSLVSTNSGLVVFAHGMDDQLWRKSISYTQPTDWARIGDGVIIGNPSCARYSSNSDDIACFAKGKDLAVWQLQIRGGTVLSGWSRLGGVILAGPTAVSDYKGTITILAQGTDFTFWGMRTKMAGVTDNWQQIAHSGTAGGRMSAAAGCSPGSQIICYVPTKDGLMKVTPFSHAINESQTDPNAPLATYDFPMSEGPSVPYGLVSAFFPVWNLVYMNHGNLMRRQGNSSLTQKPGDPEFLPEQNLGGVIKTAPSCVMSGEDAQGAKQATCAVHGNDDAVWTTSFKM